MEHKKVSYARKYSKSILDHRRQPAEAGSVERPVANPRHHLQIEAQKNQVGCLQGSNLILGFTACYDLPIHTFRPEWG